MSIQIRVSPTIVNNIAKMYQSTSRIFMEYIDNSLDSAEKLFDDTTQSYPYKIRIVASINSHLKTVTFEDNCEGMEKPILLRIVQNIGDSKKKADFVTNGQFGFGIHAYAACCKELTVLTLAKDASLAHKIVVTRAAYTDNGTIADPTSIPAQKLPLTSGTTVTLSGFDPDWWREITLEELKREIEKHFEQLLARNNLDVLIRFDGREEICKPFDYDAHDGQPLEHEIGEYEKGNSKKILPKPVRIFLKVTSDIIPHKRPIFVNKGRRIEEVRTIKSFISKTKHRTGLWGHNNLTGFIEVAGNLSPTLARDDFEQIGHRRHIYDEIVKLEDIINLALQDINKKSESDHFNKLENLLSEALSKLAAQDHLRFRNQLSAGGEVNLIEDTLSDDSIWTKKPGIGKTDQPSEKQGKTETNVSDTTEESDLKGKERNKSGFNIRFSDIEQKKADGTLLRSNYIEGDAIIIYKSHPDFKDRIKKTNQGDPKISERLVSYLASEIAIQYKDKFFAMKAKQPAVQELLNSRKDLFIDIIEFSYLFEKILQPYVGKNLLTLENEDAENND